MPGREEQDRVAGASGESLMILPAIKGHRPLLEGPLWIVTSCSDKDGDGYRAWRTAAHHAQGPWGVIASVIGQLSEDEEVFFSFLFFPSLPPSFLSSSFPLGRV